MRVILIGLALLARIEAWGADWKAYGGTGDGVFYYDAENINHSTENIVRVWHQVVFSGKGILGLVETFGQDYENLGHSISLREITCPEKLIRSLMVTYYSRAGEVLDSAVEYGAE